MEDYLPFFRGLGFDCDYAAGAAEIGDGEAKPDAFVVCAELPGGAHGEEYRRLAEFAGSTPVVAVAHVRSLSSAIDFFRAGVVDYLPAPLREDEARERILAAIARGRAPRAQEPELVEVEVEFPAGGEIPPSGTSAAHTAIDGDKISQELIPCGFMLLDGEGGLIAANRAALSLFGADSEDALRGILARQAETAQPLDENGGPLCPENWPPRKAAREKCHRARTVSVRRTDRTRVWLRIEARPEVSGGRVEHIAVTLSNVTDEHAEVLRLRGRE